MSLAARGRGAHPPECVTFPTYDPDVYTAETCYGVTSYTSPGVVDLSYTFTANSNHTEDTWSTFTYVDFIDPDDSAQNSIDVWVTAGSRQPQRVDYHTGAMGDLGCAQIGGYFDASPGDTITVEIFAYNSYDATIEFSIPYIFLDP